MLEVSNLEEITTSVPTAVAIGVFDGVHCGHQALLAQMMAQAAGLRTAVLTFFPHPKVVIQGRSGRIYLTTLEDRLRYLKETGVDLVIVHPFDEHTRHTRAAAFMDQLQTHVGMTQVWSGEFALGYKREGTAPVLTEIGREKGFTVHEVHDLLMINGDRVSSTRIRTALTEGEVAQVRPLLGRYYALTGTVNEGDKRGRTINFPTANLDVWDQLIIPGNGVYAAWATVGEHTYKAATNIGVRPTVDGINHRIEAHLLDFEGDLYGQEITLSFVERVRAEMKFSGLEALQAQIAADVEQVRNILKKEANE